MNQDWPVRQCWRWRTASGTPQRVAAAPHPSYGSDCRSAAPPGWWPWSQGTGWWTWCRLTAAGRGWARSTGGTWSGAGWTGPRGWTTGRYTLHTPNHFTGPPVALQSRKHNVPGARVASNEVAKLSQDVTSHLHHVLVAGGGLQGLEETHTPLWWQHWLRSGIIASSLQTCSEQLSLKPTWWIIQV